MRERGGGVCPQGSARKGRGGRGGGGGKEEEGIVLFPSLIVWQMKKKREREDLTTYGQYVYRQRGA